MGSGRASGSRRPIGRTTTGAMSFDRAVADALAFVGRLTILERRG
jgi:hypothetical protein